MKKDQSINYTTAAGKWHRAGGGDVNILSVPDTKIACFPIAFLTTCGDNTWSYIDFVLRILIDEVTKHPGSILDSEAMPVNMENGPAAGNYRFIEDGKPSEVALARGPEYATADVAPYGAHGLDTPDLQSLSLPDLLYEALLNSRDEMFNTDAALLLLEQHQLTFHALMWSLYQKGETYYVHYFTPDDEKQRGWNGKALPPDRFRWHLPPDPTLVAWHYAQAVKARIGGFSVGVGVPEDREAAGF